MCCYRKRIDVQGVANGMFVFGYRHGSSIPPVAAFQRIIQHFGWGVQDLVLVLHWKFGQKHMIYELYSFMNTFIIIADGRFLAFYVALVQTPRYFQLPLCKTSTHPSRINVVRHIF